MGGNALKGFETKRLSRAEYSEVVSEVLACLANKFPGRRVEVIPAYREKESFGDLDILFNTSELHVDLLKYVKEELGTRAAVRNSNIVSFEHKGFQVDLIGTPEDEMDIALAYYSWNDLGNLVGRISHKLGVKFGHRGLHMIYRDGDYQFGEYLVSRDVPAIFRFFDLDYTVFERGFDTLEDVFKFVASSKYFNKEIYLLDNRNATSRVRDNKRKTYSAFLEWVANQEGLPAYPWTSFEERGGYHTKAEFLPKLFEVFPEYEAKHIAISKEFATELAAKKLFNGELVREWTGLTGLELGLFMVQFKTMRVSYGPAGWNKFIIELGAEGVKNWVLSLREGV